MSSLSDVDEATGLMEGTKYLAKVARDMSALHALVCRQYEEVVTLSAEAIDSLPKVDREYLIGALPNDIVADVIPRVAADSRPGR